MAIEERTNKNSNWKVKCEKMDTQKRDSSTDGDHPVIFNTDTNQYEVMTDNEGWNGTEWIALAGGGGGGSVTASNGLTKVGDDIRLGGAINESTQIDLGSFDFTIQGDNPNFGLGRDCFMSFSDGVGGSLGFDLSSRSDGFKIVDTVFNRGLFATQDFSANYDDLTYVQKKYVDDAIAQLTIENTSYGHIGVTNDSPIVITEATPQLVDTWDFNLLLDGTYELSVAIEWNLNAGNQDAIFRFDVNGVQGINVNQEPKDGTNRIFLTTFVLTDLTSGLNKVEFFANKEAEANFLTIFSTRFTARKITTLS